jgi:autotransporter-associated beta strand protein
VEAGGNMKVLSGGDGLELNNASVTLNSSKDAAGSMTLRGELTSTGNSSIATAGVGANAGTVNLDGGTRDFTVASGQLDVSANITNGGLTKLGTGAMVVSGNSTYAGATTISEGTLNVSGSLSKTSSVVVADGGTLMLSGTAGSSKVNDAASVTLQDGSTVAFGAGLTNHTETVGQLTLAGDSVIDFGAGSANNILRFAISGALDWTGTLSVYNYQPGHQIFFGTQDSIVSLTEEQLNSITFYSGAGTGLLGTGQWTGNNSGQVVVGSGIGGEILPVPEPASVMSALLLLGVIGWGERGWLSRRGAVRRRLKVA